MIKLISLFIFFFALPTLAAQTTIQGTYLEMDYQFVMNDEYQDVLGTWGEARYKLEWDEYTHILQGSTITEEEYFEYDQLNGRVYLTIRCGYGQLDLIKSSTYRVKGMMCQTPIDQVFPDEQSALDFIVKRSVVEIVTEFPEPAKDTVAQFLNKMMKLRP